MHFLFLFLTSYAVAAVQPLVIGCPSLLKRPNPARITIANINIENLHDLVDDRATADEAFLPRDARSVSAAVAKPVGKNGFREYDWTREKLQWKLANLQRLHAAMGPRPDVTNAIELESETGAGYLGRVWGYDQFAMTHSPDERGMDLGTFYNESDGFLLKYRAEHLIPGTSSRNILEMGFVVNGTHKLILLIGHWPSQRNPSAERMSAANTVASIVKAREIEYPDVRIALMGDLNTIDSETPHPINDVLTKEGLLVDVEARFRVDPSIPASLRDSLPYASYYYTRDHQWNNLDRILVNRNAMGTKGLCLDLSSFRIHAPAFASKVITYKRQPITIPFRSNFDATRPEEMGFTDHFPTSVQFVDRDLEPLPEGP